MNSFLFKLALLLANSGAAVSAAITSLTQLLAGIVLAVMGAALVLIGLQYMGAIMSEDTHAAVSAKRAFLGVIIGAVLVLLASTIATDITNAIVPPAGE